MNKIIFAKRMIGTVRERSDPRGMLLEERK